MTTISNDVTVSLSTAEQNGTVEQLEEEEEVDLRWGWGSFRPSWLQFLNSSIGLLASLSICAIIYGMSVNGFGNSAIPSLEKRFHMNSKQTGLISSISHVSSMIVTIIVSFYGSFGNKPRWLGGCTSFAGFGLILFAMPHFMVGRYNPPQVKHASQFCSSAGSNTTEDVCEGGDSLAFAWEYFFTFLAAQMISGAAGAALYSLGIAYLDENVNPKYTSFYIAVFYALVFIGPSAGFVVAGKLLSTYVDITLPEGLKLSPRDPRWIGNWWIGPLVSGFVIFLIVPLIFGSPQQLPSAKKLRDEALGKNEIRQKDTKIKGSIKDIIPATKKLLLNPVFMYQTLGVWAQVVVGSGVGPFLFKLIRMYYGASPMLAGLGIGLIGSVSSIIGTCIGSIFGRGGGKLKENCRTAAKYCFYFQIFGMLMPFSFLIPGCDDIVVASQAINNSLCNCDAVKYLPVCVGKETYYSPCHAGCPQQNIMVKNYTNCSIVAESDRDLPNPHLGECVRNCKNLYVFLVIFTACLTLSYFNDIPGKIVTMRCVPENQRSYALGLQLVIWRALGALPAPVIFGSIIDRSCILWRSSCGEKGDCLAYKAEDVVIVIIIVAMIFQFFSLLSFLLSWYYASKSSFMTTELLNNPTTPNGHTPSGVEQNGDVSHTNKFGQFGMNNFVGASTEDEDRFHIKDTKF